MRARQLLFLAAVGILSCSRAEQRTERTGTARMALDTGLHVQYQHGEDLNPGDNQIKPYFQIQNSGANSVALSRLTIRYFYTREGSSEETSECYWAERGCANVVRSNQSLTPVAARANRYFQVGFTGGAGTLAPGGSSGDIKVAFHKNDWTNYSENDDFSYVPEWTTWMGSPWVALYEDGVLVEGSEPGGGGGGTGGASGTGGGPSSGGAGATGGSGGAGGVPPCSPADCNDNNPCTTDVCQLGACQHEPAPNGTTCNDSNLCTQTDTCQNGTCTGTNPVVCTPLDQCHDAGTCSPSTGTCSNPLRADGASCNDGNLCTQTDTCQGGSCTGTNPVVCTALDQCHDAGSCEASTGLCSTPPKSDGTPCDDSNACTGQDSCLAGACLAGDPVPVDDGNACTEDSCDAIQGVVHLPVAQGTWCPDGNKCNGDETCDAAGQCKPGTPVAVDDGDKCTTDTCNPENGQPVNTVIAGCIPEYDVTILLPPTVELSTVALGANGELKLGNNCMVHLEGQDGTYSTCTNVGSTTNIGVSAGLGDLWGRQNVTLGNNATVHGSLYSEASAALQDGASVAGSRNYTAEFDPVQQKSWKVTFPATMSEGFSLEDPPQPDGSPPPPKPISPGWYGPVSVKPNNTLLLQGGTYYFQRLELEPQAVLQLDQSQGPVIVYVQWLLRTRGQVVGAGGGTANPLVVYLGLQDVFVEQPFVGNLLAPNAHLVLGASNTPGHVGTFYGQDLEVYPNVSISHRPLNLDDFLYPCLFSGPAVAVGLNDDNSQKAARVVVFSGSLNNIGELAKEAWDEDRSCDAVAWGDVDGDHFDELILGSSPNQYQRVQVYDDVKNHLGIIANEIGYKWGEEYGVKALATGDLDGDGRAEIAVGRNGGQGKEVILLNDAKEGYNTIQEYDFGNRSVLDLAIGDADNDGRPEVLVALEGRSDNPDDRVKVIQDSTEGYTWSGFANWPDADRHATAIAIGDMEHDQTAEVVVGRSSGDGGRIQVFHFDQGTGTYVMVAEWGSEWDSGHDPSKLLMADLDNNGEDELIVGRNARCTFDDTFCSQTPKLLVYDAPLENGAYVQRAQGATSWPPNRGVTGLGVSDVDGDGFKEILIGKNTGAGDRVEAFKYAPGAITFLAGSGFMWGDDREVRALAVSKDNVCAVKRPPPIPQTWCEAHDQFPLRQARVIRAKLEDVLPKLRENKAGTDLFGPWDRTAAVEASRAIMAGLAAIQLGLSEGQELLAADFPGLVNQYITQNVYVFADVGTGTNGTGDFDMTLMPMLEILYRFGDAIDPRGTGPLLSDGAIRSLLQVGALLPQDQVIGDAACGTDWYPDAPLCAGNVSRLHRHLTELIPLLKDGWVPETENHMLMVNTWAYLVNYWVTEQLAGRRRGVPPQYDLGRYVNDGSGLETFLLAALGRPLQNGMWETNGRPYEAFSMRAIQILASYAPEGGKVQTAAKNALDYLATKYAFQSLHGKRLPPFRRNSDNRDRPGVYQNDYIAGLLGVLTGATVFSTDPDCQDPNCAYADGQMRGFALESALLNYRVPPAIHDLMLHPDNHHPGYGAWARMQARYTERHYIYEHAARYPVPNDIIEEDTGQPQADLNAQIRAGTERVESAPEFYFIAQDYLNSAGGKHEEYWGFPDITPESVRLGLDVWSKPTILLGNLDVGHWTGLEGAMKETFVFSGEGMYFSRAFNESRNTGVYKNFAFGYPADENVAPMIPWGVDVAARQTDQSGKRTFLVIDPDSTGRIFAAPNYYIVFGYLPYGHGTWEVVPRRLFASAEELLARVLSNNSGNEWEYKTVVSDETITLNPDYGNDPLSEPLAQPFLRIDGSEDNRRQWHEVDDAAVNSMPLIQAWQVDDSYKFTGVIYAYGTGDGLIEITNPYLGSHLQLDSRNHLDPKRVVDNEFPACQ